MNWGMTISKMNKKAILEDYKEGFDYYGKKAKHYFPLRHKSREYWELAKSVLNQANYYKHMIEQVESLGDEPLDFHC